jgi:uncharacterized protein (UPF0262 family)
VVHADLYIHAWVIARKAQQIEDTEVGRRGVENDGRRKSRTENHELADQVGGGEADDVGVG